MGAILLRDRRIVIPRPDWDAPAEPTPGRRRRSRSWRRMLAGRAGFTTTDIGGCGNCGNCGSCGYPCTLPIGSGLTMTLGPVAPTSGALAYSSGASPSGLTALAGNYWSGCMLRGGTSWWIEIFCNASCMYYFATVTSLGHCAYQAGNPTEGFDFPANCSGIAYTNRWTIASSACSPLNVVFNRPFPLSGTWTLTP